MTHAPTAHTDRTLPAPWTLCQMCGGPTPALPDPEGSPLCPACHAREVLEGAAIAHLQALSLPILGAWAQHWAAAGLTSGALYECIEALPWHGLNLEAQRQYLTDLLTRAAQAYPAPTVTPAPPDRVTFDARTLPQVLTAHLDETNPASDGPGQIDRRLYFTIRQPDGTLSKGCTLHPGPDAVLILNAGPEGDALLYYTGIYGSTEPGKRGAYRIPAPLLPQVRAALGYFTGGAQ